MWINRNKKKKNNKLSTCDIRWNENKIMFNYIVFSEITILIKFYSITNWNLEYFCTSVITTMLEDMFIWIFPKTKQKIKGKLKIRIGRTGSRKKKIYSHYIGNKMQ